MNFFIPWTACGPVKGRQGQGNAYLASALAAEFAGSETVVSSDAAVATIGAYIPQFLTSFLMET